MSPKSHRFNVVGHCLDCNANRNGINGRLPCVPASQPSPASAMGAPAELSAAARDVLAERRRQVEQEGWTPAHDDQHGKFSMSYAAACYALEGTPAARAQTVIIDKLWEWTGWSWFAWWKPKDRRRNLVRAGALILAEIERLDRATQQPTTNEGSAS